jgi:hypothetical protein
MRLITEISEDLTQLVTESKKTGEKSYFIEGVFLQAEKKNRNGRIYPQKTMDREVQRYTETYVNENRAFGELGHPSGPGINLDRVSHMITELKKDGSNYVGRAKIMDTPYGRIVKNLIKEGARLGVSSRGMGSMKQKNGANIVQDDFYLATAADIVADPSAPDAFVNGIMEGKEWIWNNGIFQESEIAQAKKEIDKTKSVDLEEKMMEVFNKFINNL